MAYRKKTLRRLTPEARKLAKAIGELDRISRKLKNLVPIVQMLEVDLRAEHKRQAYYKNAGREIKESPQPSSRPTELGEV